MIFEHAQTVDTRLWKKDPGHEAMPPRVRGISRPRRAWSISGSILCMRLAYYGSQSNEPWLAVDIYRRIEQKISDKQKDSMTKGCRRVRGSVVTSSALRECARKIRSTYNVTVCTVIMSVATRVKLCLIHIGVGTGGPGPPNNYPATYYSQNTCNPVDSKHYWWKDKLQLIAMDHIFSYCNS